MEASQQRSDRWVRDSEFLYRGAEVLLARLADYPEILKRREAAFNYRPPAASAYEAARLTAKLDLLIQWFAEQWIGLYDRWIKDRKGHVFDDGYSVLFFLRVLMGSGEVLLRGHADDRWAIETTAARMRASDPEKFRKARAAAQEFVRKVEALDFVREHYARGLRADHEEALCQHYGFPTDYVDFTFSWDVALFFAEDWMKLPAEKQPPIGAIYAVPSHVIARHASLITLPDSIMRPLLQSGKFLKCDSAAVLERISSYKFRYRHAGSQYSRGLMDITYTSWPNMTHFLLPISDPIEAIARELHDHQG